MKIPDTGLHAAAGSRQEHAAFGRELDRVPQKVDENLADPGQVANHCLGNAGVQQIFQVDGLARCGGGDQVHCALDALADVERQRLELDGTGIDAREIEDLVDHRQEAVCAFVDRFGVVALLLGKVAIEEEAGHAHDAIHGSPDFMAHVCHETGRGLGMLFGCNFGSKKLSVGGDFVGDVVGNADIIIDAAGIVPYGGIADAVPERGAVAGVVAQSDVYVVTRSQCGFNLSNGRWIGTGSVEEVVVPTRQFGG